MIALRRSSGVLCAVWMQTAVIRAPKTAVCIQTALPVVLAT
jgi:hypothetical protein